MEPNKEDVRWKDELMKYGKLAYSSGKKMEFTVIKRYGRRKWQIHLRNLASNGEEEIVEED